MKNRPLVPLVFALLVFPIFVSLPAQAGAATIQELQAQLQVLMAQLAALQSQSTTPIAPPVGSAASCPNLMRNLSRDSRSTDVTQLQQFLILQNHLAAGNNTGYYGRLTETAVKKFQCKEMSICSGSASTNGYGAVGPRTRAAVAAACTITLPTPVVPTLPAPNTTQSITPTMCAFVYTDDFVLDHRPARTLCAAGNAGASCIPNGWETHTPVLCDQADSLWYQKAIYFATGRDDSGNPVGQSGYGRVYYSPGTITIGTVLSANWPFGPIGLHIPGNVHVNGGKSKTTLALNSCLHLTDGSSCLSDKLFAVVLLAERRLGELVYTIPPLRNGSISNLIINGSPSGAASCSRTASYGQMSTNYGIHAENASGGIDIQDVEIYNTFSNGIDLGNYYASAESQSDAIDPRCAAAPVCLAKRQLFSGTSLTAPNHIRWNTICNARFGGITLVGSNTEISGNHIEVSGKLGNSTMGVSFGFVGSHDVVVKDNVISGGDYGIAGDGSYYLFAPVGLYKTYWDNAVAGEVPLSSYFLTTYSPNGPFRLGPDGKPASLDFFADPGGSKNDYTNFTQFLLDWAALANPNAASEGYISRVTIDHNTITGSTFGIGLHRSRDISIMNNAAYNVTRALRDDPASHNFDISQSGNNW